MNYLRTRTLYEAVEGIDCLTIIIDHTEFRNLALQEIEALMKDNRARMSKLRALKRDNVMRGTILQGRYGTRLRPLTHTSPKQLMPMVNKARPNLIQRIRDRRSKLGYSAALVPI